jgi:hypothetical protein
LTALYGSPGTGSVPPWTAAFRLEAFVGFLKNFQEAGDADRRGMIDAVVYSPDPNDRMVCAFASDVLHAAKRQPGIASIPGTGSEALRTLARRLAAEPASLAQATPAAVPRNAPAATVKKRAKSRAPASAQYRQTAGRHQEGMRGTVATIHPHDGARAGDRAFQCAP